MRAAPGSGAAYIPGLDGLRALSILIVVARHFEVSPYIPGGFGVTVFFFISGFLITGLLLTEKNRFGKISFPRFYARRFLRLAPALLVMLACTSGVMLALGQPVPGGELAASALYYMNYYLVASGGDAGIDTGWGPLWSLAVEEHFYLLFPLLVALCVRRTALAAIVLILFACPLLRAIDMHVLEDGALYTYLATETRIDSILWGALLAVVGARRVRWLDNRFALPLALGGLLVGFLYRDPWFENVVKYSLQGACLFACVYTLIVRRAHRWIMALLELPPVRYTGRLSYSLYLWHTHAFLWVGVLLGEPSLLPALFLAFALAALSHHFVELPFMAWRNRFRAPAAPPAVLGRNA